VLDIGKKQGNYNPLQVVKFVEKMQQIQKQVQRILQESQPNYKKRGIDLIWLHLSKERIKCLQKMYSCTCPKVLYTSSILLENWPF
jgi:hypothetical protein